MSNVKICDRCKKILGCSPSVKIWMDFYSNGTADYELCEECKHTLIAWMQIREGEKQIIWF